MRAINGTRPGFQNGVIRLGGIEISRGMGIVIAENDVATKIQPLTALFSRAEHQ